MRSTVETTVDAPIVNAVVEDFNSDPTDRAAAIGKEMAYPISAGEGNFSAGLTKREYFAAMAMQGMLATQTEEYGYEGDAAGQKYAADAVKQADELLLALAATE